MGPLEELLGALRARGTRVLLAGRDPSSRLWLRALRREEPDAGGATERPVAEDARRFRSVVTPLLCRSAVHFAGGGGLPPGFGEAEAGEILDLVSNQLRLDHCPEEAELVEVLVALRSALPRAGEAKRVKLLRRAATQPSDAVAEAALAALSSEGAVLWDECLETRVVLLASHGFADAKRRAEIAGSLAARLLSGRHPDVFALAASCGLNRRRLLAFVLWAGACSPVVAEHDESATACLHALIRDTSSEVWTTAAQALGAAPRGTSRAALYRALREGGNRDLARRALAGAGAAAARGDASRDLDQFLHRRRRNEAAEEFALPAVAAGLVDLLEAGDRSTALALSRSLLRQSPASTAAPLTALRLVRALRCAAGPRDETWLACADAVSTFAHRLDLRTGRMPERVRAWRAVTEAADLLGDGGEPRGGGIRRLLAPIWRRGSGGAGQGLRLWRGDESIEPAGTAALTALGEAMSRMTSAPSDVAIRHRVDVTEALVVFGDADGIRMFAPTRGKPEPGLLAAVADVVRVCRAAWGDPGTPMEGGEELRPVVLEMRRALADAAGGSRIALWADIASVGAGAPHPVRSEARRTCEFVLAALPPDVPAEVRALARVSCGVSPPGAAEVIRRAASAVSARLGPDGVPGVLECAGILGSGGARMDEAARACADLSCCLAALPGCVSEQVHGCTAATGEPWPGAGCRRSRLSRAGDDLSRAVRYVRSAAADVAGSFGLDARHLGALETALETMLAAAERAWPAALGNPLPEVARAWIRDIEAATERGCALDRLAASRDYAGALSLLSASGLPPAPPQDALASAAAWSAACEVARVKRLRGLAWGASRGGEKGPLAVVTILDELCGQVVAHLVRLDGCGDASSRPADHLVDARRWDANCGRVRAELDFERGLDLARLAEALTALAAAAPDCLKAALSDKGGHVLLDLSQPLMTVPWEMLPRARGAWEPVGFSLAIGRRVRAAGRSPVRPAPGGPMGLLIADGVSERDPEVSGVASLANRHGIQCEVCGPGESPAARRRFLARQWSLLHVVAHGDDGHVRLGDRFMDATDVAACLEGGRPTLVFLNACESMTMATGTPGLEMALAGCVVVGTLGRPTPALAGQMALTFYAGLLEGLCVGEALTRARAMVGGHAGERSPSLDGMHALCYIAASDPRWVWSPPGTGGRRLFGAEQTR